MGPLVAAANRLTLVEVDARNDRLMVGTAHLRLPHGQYTKGDITAVIAGKAAELRVEERRRGTLADAPAGTADRRIAVSERRRPRAPNPAAVGVATQRFLAAEVSRFRESLERLRVQRAASKPKA